MTPASPNALPAPSALEAARATVAEMTPLPWVSIETGFGETNYLICEDVPGRINPVCAMEHQSPLAENNAAGIVLAVQALRTLTDEAAVEGLARVIDPWGWGPSSGDGWEAVAGKQKEARERATQLARAIITHILTAGRGA